VDLVPIAHPLTSHDLVSILTDMTTSRTTYRALNTRAAQYIATLDTDDPLVIANRLIDRAVALQDEGRFDEADDLLAAAESFA